MKEIAGPGKKFCPTCEDKCGVRCKICPNCQHAFEFKVSPAAKGRKIVTIPNEYAEYDIKLTIVAPAGYSPVELGGSAKRVPSAEGIIVWAHAVRTHFLEKDSSFLQKTALSYFIKYNYCPFSKEYATIMKTINELPDVTVAYGDDEESSYVQV